MISKNMRGARPVDSNRPNGYDKPVKTAHLGLDCLSVIKIETGTFESTNSLTIDNNSIRYSNISCLPQNSRIGANEAIRRFGAMAL